MQLHPTRTSVEIALTGMATVAIGMLVREAAIVAWGGALLVGLALARAVTAVNVARIRAAGFEMLWRGDSRLVRVARGQTAELEAEVRNRDTRAARYVALRSVSSPNLRVELDPKEGEVPAGGRLKVALRVETPRVGRHGIYGLSLEVQGSPGLFEVPLTFANPFGIEVMPRAYSTELRTARGGRSRMSAEAGRPGPLFGDGSELRELREHQPGDPFKRIAWKASARRGALLVREYERDERDVVWLLVDASVELWAGAPGAAPLDFAIDEAAAVAQRHLARGDRVGLGIVASRVLAWIVPNRGANHDVKLMSALAFSTDTLDADRSDLDEADLALSVLEHMRPLDPSAASRVRHNDFDRVARRAERLLARGPFADRAPYAPSRREAVLRRYFAAFGINSPARLEPDRAHTDAALSEALNRIQRERPRASVVYVWSPAPDPALRPEIERAILRHPRRRVDLRWVVTAQEPSVPREGTATAPAVADAVTTRARIAQERGEAALRRLGVRVDHVRPKHARSTVAEL